MYKNESCRGHQCASLCNHIETNCIDPTLTIKASCDEVDLNYVLSIAEDAEKYCVAMSLSALIYSRIKDTYGC